MKLSTMLLAAALALHSASSLAVPTFAAPFGSDSFNCLSQGSPCLTIQAAVDKTGGSGLVTLANGTYYAGANIAHFKDITIIGNCADVTAVTINIPANQAAFWVQDMSIGIFLCMTLAGNNGARGFVGRQFSVVDYASIRFKDFTATGGHVDATEMSKVNCGGDNWVFGDASHHALASGMSTVTMACKVSLAGTPGFHGAFYIVSENSLIKAETTVYIGIARGRNYAMQTGLLRLNPSYAVPGDQDPSLHKGAQAF